MNIELTDLYKKEAEKAKIEWQDALQRLDYVDKDLFESVAYEVKSKQSRYIAFTNRLKNEVFIKEGE